MVVSEICFHAGESRNRCCISFVYIIVIDSNIAVSLAIDSEDGDETHAGGER